MKNFEDLERFIEMHNDWRDLLLKKPYALKSVVDVPYHKGWYMVNYNLFESDLADKIVQEARGTIVEVTEVDNKRKARTICAPYLKFFNFGDPNQASIDWITAKTRLKVDGQLIKMFKVKGENYWCTNGSPNVETPLEYETKNIKTYKELLFSAIEKDLPSNFAAIITGLPYYDEDMGTIHLRNIEWVAKIPDGWTLMFELTSPQNRIIVEYKETKLWFHGARDAEGNEHEPEEVAEMFGIPYKIPTMYDFDGFDEAFAELKNWNGLESEGIVVCDANYNRVKVKCDDYLKVKFIRDVSNPKGIFQAVISEEYDDLASYPELQTKAEKQKNELVEVKSRLELLHRGICNARANFTDQKSYALWVLENHKDMSKFYFSAAKMSLDDFISSQMANLKNESTGYDKYCELKRVLGL